MPHTVLASTAWLLWRTLEATGVNPAPLFKAKGVVPELMTNPQTRFRLDTVRSLWQKAVEITGDECLGIKAGEHWHPSQFGALGYAWLASSTLRSALNRASKHMRIINDIRSVQLDETPAGIVYTLDFQHGADITGTDDEVHLAVLISLCRANYGNHLNPVTVTFTHQAPTYPDVHSSHFRCPVVFCAETTSITLPVEAIDQPLPGGNPTLARMNDQVITSYLSYLDKSMFTQRVKALVIDQLSSGDLHIKKFADVLAVSVRTLQRRLDDEGTNFADILEETRREIAVKYVREKNLSMKEISFLLGFSEEAAFSRAFKRWTGHAPTAH